MEKLIIYQIDSFTKEKFKGNPAGVFINADGLSDEQMQLIARELNNSETAFLFSSNNSDCDGVIRYFTPKTEVLTCGHATIAAMYAIALEDNTTKRLIKALGLVKSDLDEKCPIQIASTGHSKVMIGIKSREKLNILTPNFHELTKLSRQIHCNGYFVFIFYSADTNILTYGRMFAPAIGLNEDLITRNTNGPLGGYLIQNRIIETQNEYFEFNGKQGEMINRH